MWPFTSSASSSPSSSPSLSADGASQSSTAPSSTLPQPVTAQLSREEQASQELAEFLKEIEVESRSLPGHSSQSTSNRDGTGSASQVDDISPDSLYPTDLSCRSSLDYAMFCQSFGGQFVNVYRYGQFRSCSNHWSDFWLCMRTRNWDEKDRAKAIRDHYRQKAVKYKTGPSSEDIWSVRTEPVREPFQESLEQLEEQIANWKKSNPDAPDPWGRGSGTLISNKTSPA